ncbi:hypothetical protein K491DRAFT_689176 [Lophiostoma macrostomum CBS 122681]|uniref:Uncharacterized protein n=1 Tax=Lophiostoma macrostomum CBS 122681 TaxID=1314788 RepID=A0A6A6TJU9_9PLEO|nr:hypothetical protein K491DRAFT_689176 [Lophiostoma macrostomum CBS 122681]
MATQTQTHILLILFFLTTAISADDSRFHNFFPRYRKQLIATRDGVCGSLFATKERGVVYTSTGESVCSALLDCMLDNTTESIKGDFASGVIALGLMPTILVYLGSTTAESALLARRRPLLAFLIAAGAPSVSPLRSFEYTDPVAQLEERGSLVEETKISALRGAVVTAGEYVVVLGAVANVYLACYYTGSWAVNTISCSDMYYTAIWASLAPILHVLGMLALRSKVMTVPRESRGSETWAWEVRQWLRYEMTPCVAQDKLVLQSKQDTFPFILVSWIGSILTVAHILYGVVAFSSLQFLGKSRDFAN